jgi:hypothetical protein
MKRGVSLFVLLAGLVAARIVTTGADERPSQARAIPIPSAAASPGPGEPAQPAARLSVCAVAVDPLCARCASNQLCPAKDLLDTIGNFFLNRDHHFPNDSCAEDAPSVAAGAGVPASKKAQHPDWGVAPEVRGTVRFVLAIVPDPAHTHLSLFFDRQIEAIQQAAQEDGYNFARASMPWDFRDHPAAIQLDERLLQTEYQRQRENLPGLMIFRKALPKGVCDALQPLFVFVVGETPTGGVNKQQFMSAVRAISDIGNSPAKPLRILGPTFSGSLYSLMFLLKQTQQEYPSFLPALVHSGTITSLGTIDWFNIYKVTLHLDFNFRSFQENDCRSLAEFIRYIKKQKYEPRTVALLSEDETAYGESSSSQSESPAERSCGDSSDVVRLFFPRDISGLRSAYQRDVQTIELHPDDARRQGRTTLRSNLEDSGEDDDSVPAYSRMQTPLSQEAVLMGIVSNLQKHHANFVLIRATNPLDSLFLARYLRSAYPDGRIVTMGADLRFQREVEDPKLRGVMALTIYSLLPGFQDRMGVPKPDTNQTPIVGSNNAPGKSEIPAGHTHSDRVFPSSLSVGTYNAMLSLLECPQTISADPTTTQPCPKLPVARYEGYSWPDLVVHSLKERPTNQAPPLSLTVLGRGGYWTLALLSDLPKPSASGADAPAPADAIPASSLPTLNHEANWPKAEVHAPLPWRILVWSCIVIAVSFLFLMRTGSLLDASDTSANFAPVNHTPKNLVCFVTDLLLLLMLLALSWPWALWGERFAPGSWSWWLVGFAAVVCVVGAFDLLRREARKLLAIFIVSAAAASAVSYCLAVQGTPQSLNFMMYRYVHITSGVSPLVPLLFLLAAGLWWAWYTLAGLALLDTSRRPRLPGRACLSLLSVDPISAPSKGEEPKQTTDSPAVPTRQAENSSIDESKIGSKKPPNKAKTHIAIRFSGWWKQCADWWERLRRPIYGERKGLMSRIAAAARPSPQFANVPPNNSRSPRQAALDQLSWEWNSDLVRLMKPNSWDLRLYFPPFVFLVLSLAGVEFMHPVRGLDGYWYEFTYAALLAFLICVLILGLARVVVIWMEFRKLLTSLEQLPLRRGFQRLKGFTWKPISQLVGSALQDSYRLIGRQFDSLEHLLHRGIDDQELVNAIEHARQCRAVVDELWDRERLKAYELKAQRLGLGKKFKGDMSDSVQRQPGWVRQWRKGFQELQVSLAAACGCALKYLSRAWEEEDEVDLFEVKHESTDQAREPQEPDEVQLAEQFVCLCYLNFMLSVIFRMRTLVMSAAGIYVLTLFSFSSYPFEPKSAFHTLAILFFLLVIGVVGITLAEMHRNTMLSRITDTKPGELGTDFWLRLASFIALPLISLLAAQFPAVNDALFSWLQPALEALK